MPRLPSVSREQLDPEDRSYFDEISESRGGIRGPYGVLLYSPELASRIAATGAYVRFEGDLPKALREVIILATAREIQSQYQFTSHAGLARQAKVSEDTIQAIALGTAPQGLSGDEELVVRYVQELLRHRKINDDTFNSVIGRFGVQLTVDLTVLIGHYLMAGAVLAAFEVEVAPGVKPELPL